MPRNRRQSAISITYFIFPTLPHLNFPNFTHSNDERRVASRSPPRDLAVVEGSEHDDWEGQGMTSYTFDTASGS